MGIKTLWLPTFFRISSFVFCIKKKVIQVWNDDTRVSKWWQNHFIFGWTITLRDAFESYDIGHHCNSGLLYLGQVQQEHKCVFWLLYMTVQLVQKRTVTSAAMFVILLCSVTSQGRKRRRTLNEKKIKLAMCDLRLNGLISAMSASCSLPLSLTYWTWVLHSVQPSQYCIICAFVFGSKRTGCASIFDVKWNKPRTRRTCLTAKSCLILVSSDLLLF